MAKKILVDLDLNQNELQNAVVQNLGTAPLNPVTGQEYFNTVDGKKYIYDGEKWVDETNQGKIYTEGNGIDITNEVVSIDEAVVALKSDIPTNYVPNTREVNGHALNADITLNAQDVGALPDDTFIPEIVDTYDAASEDGMSGKAVAQALGSYVPTSRTVNSKALSGNIVLDASDVGALANTVKYGATLSFSVDSSTYVLTAQLKDQDGNNLGTAQTVDLPVESLVLSVAYDDETKELVITLQSGSVTRVPIGAIIAGLQSEITAQNKLDADLVDDTTAAHKFATAAQLTQIATNTSDIATINGTLNNLGTAAQSDVEDFATAAQGAKADTALQEVTETDVTTALGYTPTQKFAVNNPALTVVGGVATWTITNTIANADVEVRVKEVATNNEVFVDITASAGSIVIKMNASADIAADTYKAIVVG